MAPLLEVFAAQEHHVELVSGVDESRQRWCEAGQRWGTRAVYLACGGPGLGAHELATLRQDLLALGIPPTSIWAEVVDWSQLDRLIREVDRMIDQAPPVVPAPPPLSSMRTAGPSAGPPPPPPSPLHAVGPSMIPAATTGTIAPMMPPTSQRLAPVGPGHEGARMSFAPPLAGDDDAEVIDGLEPMDSMVGRLGGWGRRMAYALGAVAVAGLVGVVVVASSDEEPSTHGGKTVTNAALEAPAGQQPAPASGARTAAVASPAGAEPQLASADAAARRSNGAAAPRSPAPAEPTATAGSPASSDDDALVHAALMKRSIRALDILLVSPEATRKIKGRRTARVLHTSWADAKAYCEALEIDGVRDWRLPTAGEFRTLGGSNMLGRRIYWSSTEGDAFGSDRVVWNNHKKRMAPAPSTWKGARVLCVRFQHPERVVPT